MPGAEIRVETGLADMTNRVQDIGMTIAFLIDNDIPLDENEIADKIDELAIEIRELKEKVLQLRRSDPSE